MEQYMTRLSKSLEELPSTLDTHISQIGQNIRLARKKRGLTMADMAERMFVTRKKLGRLENGEPSVSIEVPASALHVLGLENDLEKLADLLSDQAWNILDKVYLTDTVNCKSPIDG